MTILYWRLLCPPGDIIEGRESEITGDNGLSRIMYLSGFFLHLERVWIYIASVCLNMRYNTIEQVPDEESCTAGDENVVHLIIN